MVELLGKDQRSTSSVRLANYCDEYRSPMPAGLRGVNMHKTNTYVLQKHVRQDGQIQADHYSGTQTGAPNLHDDHQGI